MAGTYQFLSATPKLEYRDFDLSFRTNPVTGDVGVKDTDGSIKQSIKTLILTNFYERPFNPTLGGQVTGALFEIYTKELEIFLRKEIASLIKSLEPRVSLTEVLVGYNEDSDTVRSRIEYVVIGTLQTSSVEFIFERVR